MGKVLPFVRRRRWTRSGDYLGVKRASKKRWMIFMPMWAATAALGTAYGAGWLSSAPQASASAADIEWNAVQAVPRRQPDAQDIAWERRAREPVVLAADDTDQASGVQVIRGTDGSFSRTVDPATGIEVIRGTGHPEKRKTQQARGERLYAFDGDTFVMGNDRPIRIANMDAPELHPPRCAEEERLGNAAKAKLQELLGSGTITMSGSGHDRYGRELRFVQVNGQDVGEVMISEGLARSYSGKKRQPWC